MKKDQELMVITKTYDLILWSCNHTSKFPRNHRFVLGERIERNLYGLLETLIAFVRRGSPGTQRVAAGVPDRRSPVCGGRYAADRPIRVYDHMRKAHESSIVRKPWNDTKSLKTSGSIS